MALLAVAGCTGQNITVAPGWAGVALDGDETYVGSIQGVVVRLDGAKRGEQVWKYPDDPKKNIGAIYGAPALDAERVYVGSYNNRLYAFNRESGQLLWEKLTEGPIVGGPTVAGDKVLVVSSDGKLYAYKASDGVRVENFPFVAGGRIWSSPVVKGDVAYFGSMNHEVYAVSLSTGQQVWRAPVGGAVVASPLLVGDLVVVGSFDRKLYAFNAATGEQEWTFAAENWFWAAAATDGSLIYAPSLDGKLYALDLKGQKQWEFDAQSPVLSPPIVVKGGVLVASEKGRLHLVSSRDGGEEQFYDVGEKVRASVAGSGDRVALGTLGHTVLAFDAAAWNRLWSISTKK